MVGDDEVQEYLDLSGTYLQAAENNLDKNLTEPSMYNAIHSLELMVKSLLLTKIDDPIITHNVGGLLGKYFLEEIGPLKCKKVNSILIRYNFPRYPGNDLIQIKEVEEVIHFIKVFKKDLEDIIINLYHPEKSEIN